MQLVLQSPSHLTLQVAEPVQVIALEASTSSLQVEPLLQLTTAAPPSLKSQFELALHVMWLSSPPLPLHCEVSLQVTVSAWFESPLHFAPLVLEGAGWFRHSVLQSPPAAHVHVESVQAQPVPVQVGWPRLLLLQALAAKPDT